MGHLAKQLLCAVDFGCIGKDCLVCGVVLSTVTVQILEMQLTQDESGVDIVFRKTAQVPLLAGRFIPETIHGAVDWDMGSNSVMLLASAMLDKTQYSLFDSGTKQAMIDVSAAEYYTSRSEEPEQHFGIGIESVLGSGSFSHVVKEGEGRFMKTPQHCKRHGAVIDMGM